MNPSEASTLVGRAGATAPRTRSPALVPLLALAVGTTLLAILYELHKPPRHATIRASGHNRPCDDPDYRDNTLKLLFETPLAAVLPYAVQPKLEASAIAFDPVLDVAYVAFDNMHAMARLAGPEGLGTRIPFADMAAWPGDDGAESGFEFLAFNASGGSFVVGREAVAGHDGKLRGVTHDVLPAVSGDLRIGERCVTDFEVASDNKGFEGAAVVSDGTGGTLLLGLCEGNHCASGKKGRHAGHGRVVVMRRETRAGQCVWETVEVVELPAEAAFQDYSGMAVGAGRVAVVSQENAAVFIGEMSVHDGRVRFGKGKVLDFPRSPGCEVEYCNVEGVAFVGERKLVAVTDAMKGGGRQGYQCLGKDQSVHLFQLPAKFKLP